MNQLKEAEKKASSMVAVYRKGKTSHELREYDVNRPL